MSAFKKGDKVKARDSSIYSSIRRQRVKKGTEGKVLAVRPVIDQQVLVKFSGYHWPMSVGPEKIEKA